MDFASYLQVTQTPEWGDEYIDYNGLQKRIVTICRSRHDAGLNSHNDSPQARHQALFEGCEETPSLQESHKEVSFKGFVLPALPVHSPLWRFKELGIPVRRNASGITLTNPSWTKAAGQHTKMAHDIRHPPRPSWNNSSSTSSLQQYSDQPPLRQLDLPIPLLRARLEVCEWRFFIALNEELDKVESFYLAKEVELRAESRSIKARFLVLDDHRKALSTPSASSTSLSSTKRAMSVLLPVVSFVSSLVKGPAPKPFKKTHNTVDIEDDYESIQLAQTRYCEAFTPKERARSSRPPSVHRTDDEQYPLLDWSDYLYEETRLRKTALEHYHDLERLDNYRILNLTGFQKVLDAYETATNMPAQRMYWNEKVTPCAFASGAVVRRLLKELEDLHKTKLGQKNDKQAVCKLRTHSLQKTYHFSTFRSGVMLGLSIPALISGIHQISKRTTLEGVSTTLNRALPFGGVVLIYGTFFVPVVFSLLIGLNILVWLRARINYVFIFDLDVKTQLDHRQYFEIPTILLCTLCYSFYLAINGIGTFRPAPTSWLLGWIIFSAIIMCEPSPVLFKPSRYWLGRSIFRLFLSGIRRVKFTDFWLGDQFCSLTFTLANLYSVGCIYARRTDQPWLFQSRDWLMPFALASIPLVMRLLQCLRRYGESKLLPQLFNAGKYGSGVINYFFYFYWRHHGHSNGTTERGTFLVLYCMFNVIYALYSCAWDFLMDWSLFQSDSTYPLLRPQLLYANHVYMYYFAMVTNFLVRFAWISYIPIRGPTMELRTFIYATLEMLRRWQWNFYRLEIEQLANMNQ